jgi:hypothetical protein
MGSAYTHESGWTVERCLRCLLERVHIPTSRLFAKVMPVIVKPLTRLVSNRKRKRTVKK